MQNFHNIFSKLFLLPVIITALFYAGCKDNLPVIEDLQKRNFNLVNQDSANVNFPGITKGKVTVVGFIFTNCPDICPLTVNNMQRVEKKLREENIDNVEFVAISFDPERDTPQVLKDFAEIRNINFSNWNFLTGTQTEIDSVKNAFRIMAVVEDTSYADDGMPYYFFVHTDRIALVDKEGKLRKNFAGSKINIEEIVSDIKSLR